MNAKLTHELLIRAKPLRMLDRSREDRQMTRMRATPLLQVLPVAMETCATGLTNERAIHVQILQESQTDRAGLGGMVPEVLHAGHERLLEIIFVGGAFGVVTLGPPLAAACESMVLVRVLEMIETEGLADVAHVFVIRACQSLPDALGLSHRRRSVVRWEEEIILGTGQTIATGAPIGCEVVLREF